jgi:hypothetical protein
MHPREVVLRSSAGSGGARGEREEEEQQTTKHANGVAFPHHLHRDDGVASSSSFSSSSSSSTNLRIPGNEIAFISLGPPPSTRSSAYGASATAPAHAPAHPHAQASGRSPALGSVLRRHEQSLVSTVGMMRQPPQVGPGRNKGARGGGPGLTRNSQSGRGSSVSKPNKRGRVPSAGYDGVGE